VERDALNTRALLALGWRVEVLWECETKDLESARLKLIEVFG
jgi:G:T-mismatch repair DNA endonuclease (very short patch repair protein)